jgi:hypothetical protein
MIVQSLKCSAYLAALALLAAVAIAGEPAKPPKQQSETELYTITVETPCDRAILELDKFVYRA